MKNQYFGDINDYLKYGLLRALSKNGAVSTAMCWMLTEDDGKNEGKFTDYLRYPDKRSGIDPELFDKLRTAVLCREQRNVALCQELNIIPNATYFERLLTDDADGRQRYFEDFFQQSEKHDLVFFDPDNGIEVKSRKYGRKHSSKYIYWRELHEAERRGLSILLYQHYPRRSREAFTIKTARRLCTRLKKPNVYAFQTAYVVFFLVPQESHRQRFLPAIEAIKATWSPLIQTTAS